MMRSLPATFALLCALALTPMTGQAVTTLVDRIVAVVDQDVITQSELDARLRSLLLQAPEPEKLPERKVLERQLLERMISERIQLARAKQRSIHIDDERLDEIIQGIAAQNQLDLDTFRETLKAGGIEFADFREEMRTELIIKQLRQKAVVDRINISAQEVEAFIASQAAMLNQGVEYHLGHILVPIEGGNDSAAVRAARVRAEALLETLRAEPGRFSEIAAAGQFDGAPLSGSDLGWRAMEALPTLFVDVVPKMREGEVSDLLSSPSGFHIVHLIEKRGEQKHMVQQIHARHILIATNEVTSDEQARARLDELRQRLRGGADFAELARAHSDDPGSAAEGGDLGWAGPGHFVPAFEEQLDQLQDGELSEPFKTQFGWHIVQRLGAREHDDTDSFRRNKVRELLTQRKIESELESWLRQLRDEAYVEVRLEE